MALLRRREAPPAELLARLPRTERVLSWADTDDGRVVVATPSGLWWPEPEGPRLIGWQFVDKATWSESGLTVIEAEVVDDLLLVDRPPLRVRLVRPRDLPPTIRKRVDANVVRSELLALAGGAVRIVARRVPGRDGLTWWARLEDGAADTPPVRSAIAARVALLRAQWSVED